MDCNITNFWELSLAEIRLRIESYERKKKIEKKEELANIFLLASQIGSWVNVLLNGGERPREVWEAYPELFEEERKAIEEERERQELELYKAKFMDFALRHNKKFEEKNCKK